MVIGANPGYDAPADLEFAKHAAKAAFRLHVGCYADETAALSTWHIPHHHDLEAWSDLRSSDGTASIVQPLIRPLYRTWTTHRDLCRCWQGKTDASAYDLVRETWRPAAGADFEQWWTNTLHDGVIAGQRGCSRSVATTFASERHGQPTPASDTMTLVLRPDPSLWDGSFANNAWLQECPKPLTKQVWGNALALNPREAARLGLTDGDVVTLAADGRQIEAPCLDRTRRRRRRRQPHARARPPQRRRDRKRHRRQRLCIAHLGKPLDRPGTRRSRRPAGARKS